MLIFQAADWYARAFGFEEVSRLPVPDGRLMSLVMRYGDSTIHLCDEFPEMGVVAGTSDDTIQPEPLRRHPGAERGRRG